MKVRTATLLALSIVFSGFSVLSKTLPNDEKTLTFTLSPPFPDGGQFGHGCPASVPGGGTTEAYSTFMHTACCGFAGGHPATFYFTDPLPAGAQLTSIDLTVIGAVDDEQPPEIRVYLNELMAICPLIGPGAGYPLGSFVAQGSPFRDGAGHCIRNFQSYTVSKIYDVQRAFAVCSLYNYKAFGGANEIGFRDFQADFEYSEITLTLHYKPFDYTAVAQILDGSAEESKPISASNTTYAQVPLGLELQLGLKDAKGDYVPAKYDLSAATLTGLEKDALYPTNALLEYGRTVSEKQKTFRAVHSGTQTLTITPDDTKLPKATFTLGVFDPGSLGNTDVQYDQMFVDWGNKRGIPPHILKGLIRKEGPFDPFSYRYEPISKTTGDRYIQTVLTAPTYSSYILATATGLGQGVLLTADDIEPRNVFTIATGQITPSDLCPAACVSARDIFENNDGKQNWSDPKYVGSTNWWDPANLKLLEFTAQTPLASSYGLMQTMYVKAKELNWVTKDGRRNPALLFDTPANAAIGGGSVAVGTLEFYKAYRACNTGNLATDPDFADSAAYKSQIVDTMNWYNHGNASRNQTYGDDAWGYSLQFSPSHPLSKIFP